MPIHNDKPYTITAQLYKMYKCNFVIDYGVILCGQQQYIDTLHGDFQSGTVTALK